MRIKMIAAALGLAAVLVAMSSSASLGAVVLDENSMGLIRGGTPVRYYCNNAKCSAGFCDPLTPDCPSGETGYYGRCTSSHESGTCKEYVLGFVSCTVEENVEGWCGTAIEDSVCSWNAIGPYTCSGGEVTDPPIQCNAPKCTTSN